nr:MAG TPA: hypothetical protein [Caudoviricetes sp.]
MDCHPLLSASKAEPQVPLMSGRTSAGIRRSEA